MSFLFSNFFCESFWIEFSLAGSPKTPQPQWSPPPPHTRHTAPLASIQPNFFGQRRGSPKLNSLDNIGTLNLNSKLCAPIMGGRTFLTSQLFARYGCRQDIATNIFPPNEDSPCI
jgi:hypothetical protein